METKDISNLFDSIKTKFGLSASYYSSTDEIKVLPIIRYEYDIKPLKIELIEFIGLISKNPEEESFKRIKMVQEQSKKPIVYISEKISTPIKDQLIKAHISFISNDIIYLFPMLCFQDNKIKQHKSKKNLNVSAQPVLLYMLYNQKDYESFDIDSLKSFFKQSAATLYRHINTLYNLGLIESTEEFSKRKVFQLNKHISFEEILLQMRTPIKDITFIKSEDYERVIGKNYHLFAGESALHPYNLIVDKTTLALSYIEMKNPLWDRLHYSTRYYEEYIELQQWYYDPLEIVTFMPSYNTNVEEKYVDPISLYLSLRESNDADMRVNDSIEALLKSIKREYGWNTI